MRYGDDVTILRPGPDEYGNPGQSFDTPASTTSAKAFVLGDFSKAFLPVGTDVRHGDRLVFRGLDFDVVEATTIRSPSKDVLMTATLARVKG